MKILVTGATGNVGGELVKILHQRGAEVRALARNPQAAKLPAAVEVVPGDMTDPESIREAVFDAIGWEPHGGSERIGQRGAPMRLSILAVIPAIVLMTVVPFAVPSFA